eukprot:SAG31_NODE_1685_length_7530_cov_9.464944_1_plen_909_part_00
MIIKPVLRKTVAFAVAALIAYKLYSIHQIGWAKRQQQKAVTPLAKPVWRPRPHVATGSAVQQPEPSADRPPPLPPPPTMSRDKQLAPVLSATSLSSSTSSSLPWPPSAPVQTNGVTRTEIVRPEVTKTTKGIFDMWNRYPTLDMTNHWLPPAPGSPQGAGSWTQGWDYKADDALFETGEKLEIYVIPHSHNDPGWKETFEEWYGQKTGRVLDTMVDFLGSDPRYRFQWSEVSFLQLWWDANPGKRDKLVGLIKRGQLELTGGGLTMNDEGLTTLFAILENLHEGRQWIKDNIGVDVVSSWQNDPFGLSPTMPYLFSEMGYRGMWIQRVHYRVKWMLAKDKAMEFWWRQRSDTTGSSDMLTHLNPFYAYDVPHTCGPQPGICCQFDFVRMSNSHPYKGCPWNVPPKSITASNVAERAATLLDQYRKKAMLFRTKRLLVPIGNDFEFMQPEFARLQYENYQRLFDYMNSNTKMNVHARFATLAEYFADLQQTVTVSTSTSALPVLHGSFFTYSDREDEFWSGFYSSRPFIKCQARELESLLHAAEILREKAVKPADPGNGEANLQLARRMLSIFQHHDAITGTASAKTVRDYNKKLHDGLLAAGRQLEADVGRLLGVTSKVERLMQRMDMKALPEAKLVAISQLKQFSVAAYNPTGLARSVLVRVMVDTADVCVDGTGHGEFQVSPAVQVTAGKLQIVADRYEIIVPVKQRPFGLSVITIRKSGAEEHRECKALPASVWSSTDIAISSLFPRLQSSDEMVLSTTTTRVQFDQQGKLRSIQSLEGGGFTVDVSDTIVQWQDESKHAGAYLFRPARPSEPAESTGAVIVVSGKFLGHVYSEVSPFASRVATVTAADGIGGRGVGLDYYVDINKGEWGNKEIGLKIRSSIDSGRVFYTGVQHLSFTFALEPLV